MNKPAETGFRHEAFLYSGWAEFVAGTVPFIKGGIEAGEPVLVVESPEKIELLQVALGRDADKVLFADMARVGANPALIIPAWRDFVEHHATDNKRLRGIGEPIWNGRTADQLVECQRHESLLNVAFWQGQPWTLLCPYDVEHLAPAVIDEARRSHEFVSGVGASSPSPDFRGVEACGACFDVPFPAPPAGSRKFSFDADNLLGLRGQVTRFATATGLSAARATELVTAVNEVATNSIVHGGGKGTLRMWGDGSNIVCEVRDSGHYDVPLGDRAKPGPGLRESRGLWLANHLCDLVQIRTFADGTVVRLHTKVDPRHHLRVVPS
jgi:anti-sigma regulatory factor (Ser/Thr protein kinase)